MSVIPYHVDTKPKYRKSCTSCYHSLRGNSSTICKDICTHIVSKPYYMTVFSYIDRVVGRMDSMKDIYLFKFSSPTQSRYIELFEFPDTVRHSFIKKLYSILNTMWFVQSCTFNGHTSLKTPAHLNRTFLIENIKLKLDNISLSSLLDRLHTHYSKDKGVHCIFVSCVSLELDNVLSISYVPPISEE